MDDVDRADDGNHVQILKKGEVQVGEKERERDLSALRKEIATLVSEKCVDPTTQRAYAVGMIEKAMAKAGFSVKQNKTAKSQVRVFIFGVPCRSNVGDTARRCPNASSCCRVTENCRSNGPGCDCVCRYLPRTSRSHRRSLKARRRSKATRRVL